MAVRRDITLTGRDRYGLRLHFTRTGVDVDVTGDVFVAEVRKREDLGSEVLAVFSQTPEPGDASRVTFGLDSSQVESAPPVAWYRIARLIGGDADAEQGIFEGRVRHE